jgi:hypothetical protein
MTLLNIKKLDGDILLKLQINYIAELENYLTFLMRDATYYPSKQKNERIKGFELALKLLRELK